MLHPHDEGYDHLRSHFYDVPGKPSLTLVTIALPDDRELSTRIWVIARACLGISFHDQVCFATDFGDVNTDLFFEIDGKRIIINGIEQLHVLFHLVIACRHDLGVTGHKISDHLFKDEDGMVLVFAANLPIRELLALMSELEYDLEALLDEGTIQGRIAELVFKPPNAKSE